MNRGIGKDGAGVQNATDECEVSIRISWEGWGAGVWNATDECEGEYSD